MPDSLEVKRLRGRAWRARMKAEGRCTQCGGESPDGGARCPPCRLEGKIRARRYIEKNTEKRGEITLRSHLKSKYGLTMDRYLQFLADQKGACAVCHQPPVNRLVVDHCHITGEVRGLLCHKCNTGLGQFGDSIDRMTAGIAYLQRFLERPK